MKRVYACIFIIAVSWTFLFSQQAEETIEKAQALQNSGAFKEAVDMLSELVDTQPENAEARLALGQAMGAWGGHAAQTGDMTAAMQAITGSFDQMEKAIVLKPAWFEAHFYFGVYGVMVPSFFGQLERGVERLEKSLSLITSAAQEEYKPAVYRYLGHGYTQQGLTDKARTAFKQVLVHALSGEHADVARAGLDRLKSSGDKAKTESFHFPATSDAAADLLKIADQNPDEYSSWYNLGRAYFEEGQFLYAIEALKKAMELNPESPEGAFLLARAYSEEAAPGYDENVYDDVDWRTHLAFEGTRWLEKAYELEPDNIEFKSHYAIGSVLMPFFVNRLDKGIKLLEELIDDAAAAEEVKKEARFYLGYAYRKKGNAHWLKLVTDFPDAEPSEWVYEEYGLRYHEAREAPKGKHAAVRFHLGFLDELEPQVALWVEDDKGGFVKTLYVSGFSAFAKEKQINLFKWSEVSDFQADGVSGASIDWGTHCYYWDLTDVKGNRVKDGVYHIHIEASWWPSMKYSRAHVSIHTGEKSASASGGKMPFIPLFEAEIKSNP